MKSLLPVSLCSLGAILSITACTPDEGPENINPVPAEKYIIGVQSQGSNDDFSDYCWQKMS